MIVRVAPDAIEPREHGYAVEHAPELETNVRPLGVVSATLAPAASEGPLFVTVTV